MIGDDGATARRRNVIERRRSIRDTTTPDRLNSSSATVQPHGVGRATEAKAATGSSFPPRLIPGG
jgi:hypothetical protein